jgi:quinol monooxygenase YgiN
MHARVIIGSFQQDKVDEAIKITRDFILPAVKQQKGFKKYLALTDYATGKSMNIVLWNSEADMMASDNSEVYREQVAKVVPFFAGSLIREHYEVVVQG